MEIEFLIGTVVVVTGFVMLVSNSGESNKNLGSKGGPKTHNGKPFRKAPKIFYQDDYSFRHPFSADDDYFNHFIERYRRKFLSLIEDKEYTDRVIDDHMEDPVLVGADLDHRFSVIYGLDKLLSIKIADEAINTHMPVLVRKYKQLTYKNDYGVSVKEKWEREAKAFTKSVLLPHMSDEVVNEPLCRFSADSLVSNDPDTLRYWANHITTSVESEIGNDAAGMLHPQDSEHMAQVNMEDMNGIEYEEYVADIIESLGWEVTPTPATGDHGADVIADKDQHRIVVQCKKYSSPVGNKSVQEAFSAKTFYDCTHSVVVTNNSFTPAARQAASKLNVHLLHHEELQEYLEHKLA